MVTPSPSSEPPRTCDPLEGTPFLQTDESVTESKSPIDKKIAEIAQERKCLTVKNINITAGDQVQAMVKNWNPVHEKMREVRSTYNNKGHGVII